MESAIGTKISSSWRQWQIGRCKWLFFFFWSIRSAHEAAADTEGDICQRGKGINKRGIYPSGTGSGKEGEYALVLGDSDHLCYGDSRIRIAVYHGGIFEKGESGSKLQRKAAGDFSAYGLTAKTKELCERKRNFDRRDILYENGMSVESL